MPLHAPPQQPLAQGELPPPPVAWLHPLELLRTAYHAWLSGTATAFIDRREVLAALDRQPPGIAELRLLSSLSTSAATGETSRGAPVVGLEAVSLLRTSEPFLDTPHHQSNGVWVDFIADVGDSWEATHATAALIAQPALRPRGHERDEPLPYADVVVLGGDLVYPSPTRDGYRRRTREPIGSALPQVEKGKTPLDIPRQRHLVAIPGNHDWYDGLTSFVREFCQGGWLGGWQLLQMRSYFALKLMDGWWVWGIDIALDTRIDPAQQNFFLDILGNNSPTHQPFRPGDNVILCTAKPSWLQTSRYSEDAYRNLAYFVSGIIKKCGGRVPLILSGDLHHYSRYESATGEQFITSGSGGSYLMGTHHLPDEVPPLRSGPSPPGAAPSPGYVRAGFPYPSQADSRRLALRALRLAFLRANIPFCLTVGLISLWLVSRLDRVFPGLSSRPFTELFASPVTWNFDVAAIVAVLAVVVGCAVFARKTNSRASRRLTCAWGALHGLAHVGVAVLLAWVLLPHPLVVLGAEGFPYIRLAPGYEDVAMWLSTVADATVIVLIAGWLGGTLVGVYLTISDLALGWHQNESFAAQSIFDYRSFVRIHLQPKVMTIYPIGLRSVPKFWRARLERGPTDPNYEPVDAVLTPHLIEGPITVKLP